MWFGGWQVCSSCAAQSDGDVSTSRACFAACAQEKGSRWLQHLLCASRLALCHSPASMPRPSLSLQCASLPNKYDKEACLGTPVP